MKTKITLLLLGIFILTSCEKTDIDNKFQEKDILLQKREIAQIKNDNKFGIQLFKQIVGNEEAKNTMVSPFSISQALLMAYNGADGKTKKEFASLLNTKEVSIDELNKTHQKLSKLLVRHDQKVLFSIANSIWYDNKFPVKKPFVEVNKSYYNAEVSKLNFGDIKTVNKINGWVANKTNQKIKKIIDRIDPSEVLFLINAIYFKADWQHKFDKSLTTQKTFITSKNSKIKVPMMVTESSFNYAQNNYGEIVELPYGRGKFSMLLIRPKKKINELISKINSEKLTEWNREMNKQKVIVNLPKFEFSYKKKLNETLQEMGLLQAFQNNANFTKISDISIKISKVLHKTYIKTDEKGSEAAAVTSIGVVMTSAEPQKTIITFDKPFVFIIREKDTSTILFAGKVENPLEK